MKRGIIETTSKKTDSTDIDALRKNHFEVLTLKKSFLVYLYYYANKRNK